jgi:hypothetical protein
LLLFFRKEDLNEKRFWDAADKKDTADLEIYRSCGRITDASAVICGHP